MPMLNPMLDDKVLDSEMLDNEISDNKISGGGSKSRLKKKQAEKLIK